MIDQQPLQLTGRATLDAAGTATITFSGPGSNTRRQINSVSVSCTSSTPRPVCIAYRASIAPHRELARTRLGDGDVFIGDTGDVLETGEPLILQWTGGLPGATAVANANITDLIG